MQILNLTQHSATEEQLAVGIEEPSSTDKAKIADLLTFEELPDVSVMQSRAAALTHILDNYECSTVMIGGAPYFMPVLEKYLKEADLKPVYAFSKRVVEERELEDGTVEKIFRFKHEGFVEV